MKKTKVAFFLLIITGTFLIAPQTTNAQDMSLNIGDPAPEFEALSANGELWHSSDHTDGKFLVVYFYPAAMTGGCTAQACSFRDNRTQLTELGAEVVGISGDSVENLVVFKRVNNLNFPLLSDPEGTIARSFGVPTRAGASITREVDGEDIELSRDITFSRWTFIINPEGTIVYKDTEVDAAGDSEAVIVAIRNFVAEE